MLHSDEAAHCWFPSMLCMLIAVMFAVRLEAAPMSNGATLVVNRQNLTELDFIHGTSLLFTIREGNAITSDQFVAPVSSAIANELISSFKGPTNPGSEPTNFAARRSLLLVPSASFHVSSDGKQLTVHFVADTGYDIHAAEVVSFKCPGAAFISGSPANNTIRIPIFVSRGTISSSLVSVTENLIRSGGATFTLTLAPGEQWKNVSAVTTVSEEKHRHFMWDDLKHLIVRARTSFVISSPSTVTVTLFAAPTYDASVVERIVFHIPDGSTKSGLAPQHPSNVFLRISPTRGTFHLLNPTVVAESALTRDAGASLVVFLETGERWCENVSVPELRASLSSSQSSPAGFNARKGHLLKTVPHIASSGHELHIFLHVDESFNVDTVEQIVVSHLSPLVRSGLEPQLKSGPGFTSVFSISPSPGILEVNSAESDEARVVSGGASFVLRLGPGELFVTADINNVMKDATQGSLHLPTAFSALRNELLPAGAFVVSPNGRECIVSFMGETPYDIPEIEVVSIIVSASVLRSGLSLHEVGTFSIHIKPVRGLLTVAHELLGTVQPFRFSESHIREGAGRILLNWTSQESWREGAAISPSNLSVLVSGGFAGFRQRANYIVAPTKFADEARRAAIFTLQPDKMYDIAASEVVNVVIPRSAISSRMPSSDGTESFQLRISPVAGTATLHCCSVVTEADINRGGVVLEVLLHRGETWVPGFESLWSAAFLADESSSGTGWSQFGATIVPPTAFRIKNSSRLMQITLQGAPLYKIGRSEFENITLHLAAPFFPAGFVASSIPLTTPSLRFAVRRTPTVLNLTVLFPSEGYGPIDELALRSLSVELYLELHNDEWISGSEENIIAGFVANNTTGSTTFNALKGSFLPDPSVVTIPPQESGNNIMMVKLAPVGEYNINTTEQITFVAPPASLKSGSLSVVASFDVSPARGSVHLIDFQLDEKALRFGGAFIILALSAHERWLDPFADAFPVEDFIEGLHIKASVPSPLGISALRRALITKESFVVDRQHMIVNLHPVPLIDIAGTENVSISVPGAMVASGLSPFEHSLWAVASPQDVEFGERNFTVSELDLVHGTSPIITFRINGGTLSPDNHTLARCFGAIVAGAKFRSSDSMRFPHDELGLAAQLPWLLDVNRSFKTDSSRTALGIVFQPVSNLRIAGDIDLLLRIPSQCFLGAVREPLLRVRLVASLPKFVTRPRELHESYIRGLAGSTFDVNFTLFEGDEWTDQVPSLFVQHLRVLPASAVPSATAISRTGFAMLLQAPSACRAQRLSSHRVQMSCVGTAFFDVNTTETLIFALHATGEHFPLTRSTVVPMAPEGSIVIYPEPAVVVITPGNLHFDSHDLRGGFRAAPVGVGPPWTMLPVTFNVTLQGGERFVESAASSIVAATSSNETGNLHASGFMMLKDTILPTATAVLSRNRHQVSVQLVASHDFWIEQTVSVSFEVPSSATESGLAPIRMDSSRQFDFVIAPSRPAKAHVSPRHLNEAQFLDGNAKVSIVLVGPLADANDTWVREHIGGDLENVRLHTPSIPALKLPPHTFRVDHQDNTLIIEFSAENVPVDFDIDTPTEVSVRIMPNALFSKTQPHGALTFMILPSPGKLSLVATPAHVTEHVFNGLHHQVLVLEFSLVGDLFISSKVNISSLAKACRGPVQHSRSWEARRSSLLNSALLSVESTGRSLRIEFQKDFRFDLVDLREQVNCSFTPEMLLSGIRPANQVHFVVHSAPGTVSLVSTGASTYVSEEHIRNEGATFLFQIKEGERFCSSITENVGRHLVSSSVGKKWLYENFNASTVMGKLRSENTELVMTISRIPKFDLRLPLDLRFCPTEYFVQSKVHVPHCQMTSVNITLSAGTVEVVRVPSAVLDVVLGATIVLELRFDHWILSTAATHMEVVSSVHDGGEGFDTWETAIIDRDGFHLSPDRRSLTIKWNAAPHYRPDRGESLLLSFPPAAFESNMYPSGLPVVMPLEHPRASIAPTMLQYSDLHYGATVQLQVEHGAFNILRADFIKAHIRTVGIVGHDGEDGLEDPFDKGLRDVILSALQNAVIDVAPTTVTVRLPPLSTKEFFPCHDGHLIITLDEGMFVESLVPQMLEFVIAVRAPRHVISLEHPNFPANSSILRTSEREIRERGFSFDIVLSYGDFTTITKPELLELFSGTLDCATCFGALREQILEGTTDEDDEWGWPPEDDEWSSRHFEIAADDEDPQWVISPNRIRITFHQTPQFNAHRNDTVYIDFQPYQLRCPAAGRQRLAVIIDASAPQITFASLTVSQLRASEKTTLRIEGYEVDHTNDDVRLLRAGLSCRAAGEVPAVLVLHFPPKSSNVTFSAGHSGEFVLCYRHFNFGHFFSLEPLVGRLIVMPHAVGAKLPSEIVASDSPFPIQVLVDGLNFEGADVDRIKLISGNETEASVATNPCLTRTPDAVDGVSQGFWSVDFTDGYQLVTFGMITTRSSFVTVCFAPAYNQTAFSIGTMLVLPNISSVSPSAAFPHEPVPQLTIVGVGLDVRGPTYIDGVPRRDVIVLTSSGSCDSPSRIYCCNLDDDPDAQAEGIARGARSATVSIPPEQLLSPQLVTVCYRSRYSRSDAWQRFENLFSIVNSISLFVSQSPNSKYFQRAGQDVFFTLQGEGLRNGGRSMPVVFVISAALDCSNFDAPGLRNSGNLPSDGGVVTNINAVTQTTVVVTVVFSRIGQFQLCWATEERYSIGQSSQPVPNPNGLEIHVAPLFTNTTSVPAVNIHAGTASGILLTGVALDPANMSFFVTRVSENCDHQRTVVSERVFSPDHSGSTLLANVVVPVSGEVMLCIRSDGIDELDVSVPIRVHPKVTYPRLDDLLEMEVFQNGSTTFEGFGFDASDVFYQAAPNCSYPATAIPLDSNFRDMTSLPTGRQSYGSVNVLVLTTLLVPERGETVHYELCISPHSKSTGAFVLDRIASVIVRPPFPRVSRVTTQPLSFSSLDIHFFGVAIGINDTAFLSWTEDCMTSVNASVPFDPFVNVNNLRWNFTSAGSATVLDKTTLRLHALSGFNSTTTFYNLTICYEHNFTAAPTANPPPSVQKGPYSVAQLYLPFANTPPSFAYSARHVVYSREFSVERKLPLIFDGSVRMGLNPQEESTQEVTFFVLRTNASLENQLKGPPEIDQTGVMVLKLRPQASGIIELTFFCEDDGGVLFGGANRSIEVTVHISLIFALNSPPSFSISQPLIHVPASRNPLLRFEMPNFAINIRAGNLDSEFEAHQNVTFTVVPDDGSATLWDLYLSDVTITADGTLIVDVREAAAQLRRHVDVILWVTALDNAEQLAGSAGTPTDLDNGGPLSLPSEPVLFTLKLVVMNYPPTFNLIVHPSEIVIFEEDFGDIHVAANITAGYLGEAQNVTFEVLTAHHSTPGIPAASYFTMQPALSPAGQLTFLPTANGNGVFDMTITAVDDGGTLLGGVDRSTPVVLTLIVLRRFSLTLSPSTGQSFQTNFVIRAEGGTALFNHRLRFDLHFLVLGLHAGEHATNSSILLRPRIPFNSPYTASFFPSGNITLFCVIRDDVHGRVGAAAKNSTIESAIALDVEQQASNIRRMLVSDPDESLVATLGLSLFVSERSIADDRLTVALLHQEYIASRTVSGRRLNEPEVALMVRSLRILHKHPAQLHLLPQSHRMMRRLQQEQLISNEEAVYKDLREATEVLRRIVNHADRTIVFTDETKSEVVMMLETLLQSGRRVEFPLWKNAADAADNERRRLVLAVQNSALFNVIDVAARLFQFECHRHMNGPISSITFGISTIRLQIAAARTTVNTTVFVNHETRVPTSSPDISVGISWSVRVPSIDTSVCSLVYVLQSPILQGSGDPMSTPRTPPGVVGVVAWSAEEVGFSQGVPSLSALSVSFGDAISGRLRFLHYDQASNDFSPITPPGGDSSFSVHGSADTTILQATDHQVFGISSVARDTIVTPYPVIILPVVVGLLIFGLLIAAFFDSQVDAAPFLNTPEHVEMLSVISRTRTAPRLLLSLWLLTAPFVPSEVLSSFSRTQRAILFFTMLFGTLATVTLTQPGDADDDSLMNSSRLKSSAIAGVALYSSIVAAFVTWAVLAVFVASDIAWKAVFLYVLPTVSEPPVVAGQQRPKFSQQLVRGPSKVHVVAGFTFAGLVITLSVVATAKRGSTFETQQPRNMNWQAVLLSMCFSLLWDLGRSIFIVTAVRWYFRRRYSAAFAKQIRNHDTDSADCADEGWKYKLRLPGHAHGKAHRTILQVPQRTVLDDEFDDEMEVFQEVAGLAAQRAARSSRPAEQTSRFQAMRGHSPLRQLCFDSVNADDSVGMLGDPAEKLRHILDDSVTSSNVSDASDVCRKTPPPPPPPLPPRPLTSYSHRRVEGRDSFDVPTFEPDKGNVWSSLANTIVPDALQPRPPPPPPPLIQRDRAFVLGDTQVPSSISFAPDIRPDMQRPFSNPIDASYTSHDEAHA